LRQPALERRIREVREWGSDIPVYSERVARDKRVENHCFRGGEGMTF